ncbi:MAG TPA: DNA polymerase III subunit beta [Candidatus Paceibacterota bacterium]
MRFECEKEKIKGAVALAEKMTGKNVTLPVLQSLLFVAQHKSLKIRATNLDIGIEIEIPAKIETEGIVAVPGALVNQLLSNIPDKTIVFELENGNLLVATKNSNAVIKSYPYDDFPTLPTIHQKKESFVVSAEKLVSGLRNVWYSAAQSDIKPEIASVYLYGEGEEVFFVATDSFRLAEKSIALSVKNQNIGLIIPFKNVIEIVRVFDTISGEVTVSWNTNQVSFEHEGVYITSRLIDGIYPDYKQIMPKGHTTEAVVLRQDFLNALKVSNLFSDRFNQITLSVNPRSKKFELRSKNPDIGENTIRVDAALSGDPVDLNFNHKYIIDCFQSLSKDSISIQLNGAGKPAIIKGVGDRSFAYLVMPLNQ